MRYLCRFVPFVPSKHVSRKTLLVSVSMVVGLCALLSHFSKTGLQMHQKRRFTSRHLISRPTSPRTSSYGDQLGVATTKGPASTFQRLRQLQTTANLIDTAKMSKRHEINQLHKKVKLFQTVMTRFDTVVMKDLLGTFIYAVQQANLTYMMHGGTLLGSYRHHGMVPWDDDIDLFLEMSQRARLKTILDRLAPQFILHTKTRNRWKFYDEKKSRPIHGRPWKYPFLDLCFYYQNKNFIWDVDPWLKKRYRYPKSNVFPLIQRPFGDLMLPAPRRTKAVIEQTYSLDRCQTTPYNHSTEHRKPGGLVVTVPCAALRDSFPFVSHHVTSQGDNETLEFNRRILQWKFIPNGGEED